MAKDVKDALVVKGENMDEQIERSSALLKKVSESELAKRGFSNVTHIKLEEGDGIAGTYLGPGPNLELKNHDEETGEVKYLQTWMVQPEGAKEAGLNVVFRVQGTHQLNVFFSGCLPGFEIGAFCLGRKQIGPRQVMTYRTWTNEVTAAKIRAQHATTPANA